MYVSETGVIHHFDNAHGGVIHHFDNALGDNLPIDFSILFLLCLKQKNRWDRVMANVLF